MGIRFHLQPLNIKGHAWVTEGGYMISFATSQYQGSCLGYRGWVYDFFCNLSTLRVTPWLPRMGIWFHLQPLNIMGHNLVIEDGYMISFATSKYYGPRLGYWGLVYDFICNLSIFRVTPGLPRMGIWFHLQSLNNMGHNWGIKDGHSLSILQASSQDNLY